jgi:hypothetical protein
MVFVQVIGIDVDAVVKAGVQVLCTDVDATVMVFVQVVGINVDAVVKPLVHEFCTYLGAAKLS